MPCTLVSDPDQASAEVSHTDLDEVSDPDWAKVSHTDLSKVSDPDQASAEVSHSDLAEVTDSDQASAEIPCAERASWMSHHPVCLAQPIVLLCLAYMTSQATNSVIVDFFGGSASVVSSQSVEDPVKPLVCPRNYSGCMHTGLPGVTHYWPSTCKKSFASL